MLNRIKI